MLCEFIDSLVLWGSSVFVSAHEFGRASSNYGSLVAALMATFIAAPIIFLIKENKNRGSDFSGVFWMKSTTLETSYNPYRGLQVFHTLVIYSDGYSVGGTSEKTGEISSVEPKEYVGKDRRRGTVTGRIERNYTRQSFLHLHIVENGERRDSTLYIKVPIKSINKRRLQLGGEFYSTAANSTGNIVWKRNSFSEHP